MREAWVWNASDGLLLGQLILPEQVTDQHCWPLFSPDNKKIVTICAEGLITWDSADFRRIGRIKISRNPDAKWFEVFLSWNPVTHEMTAVDADGKVLRVDLEKQTASHLLANQEKAVRAAGWSRDGRRLVTVDRDDRSVTVWDIASGTPIAHIAEEADFASFSPDGERVVTRSPRPRVDENGKKFAVLWDRRTRIWDARSGRFLQELPTIANVTLSHDWSFWMDAGVKGVRIARFDGSELCCFPERFDGHGSIRAFSPDNRHAAYVNASGLVVVWEYHDPLRSWSECLMLYELWVIVLAGSGVALIVWGRMTRKHKRATDTCRTGINI